MQRDIHHTWFFPQPPALVWDYLTKPELIAQWLMENNFQLIVGHHFQFMTKPRIKLGFDGKVYCQVLEIVPLKLLSYSWKGGVGEKTKLDSIVTWTLTPKNNGTELSLVHSGFKGMKNYLSYLIMNKGWAKIGKRFGQPLTRTVNDTTNA